MVWSRESDKRVQPKPIDCTMRILLLLVALALTMPALADTLTGRVVAIADGDTLTLLDVSFQQHKVRLVGIDAPESEQPSALARSGT